MGRTFAAIMIQRRYRVYYREYKMKRLHAAKTIQGWIREAMHQRQLTLCRKLWGAISMQKLFRGYISRKKSAEEQINYARRIVLLQSLFRKRLAWRVLRRKMSN